MVWLRLGQGGDTFLMLFYHGKSFFGCIYLRFVHIFQSYFYNSDTFNFNYAQAKAAVGNFSEAEEVCIYFFGKQQWRRPPYSPLSFLYFTQIFMLVENKQVLWNIFFPFLEELKLSVSTIQKRLSC